MNFCFRISIKERFEHWRQVNELSVWSRQQLFGNEKVNSLSDGNRMKLMIAGVLARDTKMLLMDEPGITVRSFDERSSVRSDS